MVQVLLDSFIEIVCRLDMTRDEFFIHLSHTEYDFRKDTIFARQPQYQIK